MGSTYSHKELDFLQDKINGKISTALIAQEFNTRFDRQITKNAIVGLTNRGQLKSLRRFPKIRKHNPSYFLPGHKKLGGRRKGYIHSLPYQRRETMPQSYPSVEPEMRKLIFWQSGPRDCKFILGQVIPESICCGNPADDDCSYCRYHRGIVFGHTRVETLQAAE